MSDTETTLREDEIRTEETGSITRAEVADVDGDDQGGESDTDETDSDTDDTDSDSDGTDA